MSRLIKITALIIFLIIGISSAKDCFLEAGEYYNINSNLLKAIAEVESQFNPYAININNNGSYDIGIMQINSWWMPKIIKMGYKPSDLYNPCINIYIGAWILANCIAEKGYNWKAIDCYNKGSKKAKNYSSYVKKVFNKVYKNKH